MGTGRDMLFYVYGWMGKGKLFLGFCFIEIWELGVVGYDIKGRNEWRNLIFISRIYKWNLHLFLCLFLFSSFFGHL